MRRRAASRAEYRTCCRTYRPALPAGRIWDKSSPYPYLSRLLAPAAAHSRVRRRDAVVLSSIIHRGAVVFHLPRVQRRIVPISPRVTWNKLYILDRQRDQIISKISLFTDQTKNDTDPPFLIRNLIQNRIG